MSTYLVAFIIAPFLSSPTAMYFNSSYNGENGVKPIYTIGQPKYFTPKRQDELCQLSGVASLNTMTELTGVGYGLGKMDQAGIPDFAAGAMENWGLVTYREGYTFWDNDTGSTSSKVGVASVVAHELAHQWFGDLVTLHWWTDLWLNEGFADFFEYHLTDLFREPGLDTSDWDMIGQFVTDNTQGGSFVADARPNSRPLTSEAYDPNVIGRFGDTISYNKGGSVIRMWMHALGTDIFYSGLSRYLKAQAEGLGTPEALLGSWDAVVDALPQAEKPDLDGLTPSQLFQLWHKQAGYPVVTVESGAGQLTISQKRFLTSSGNTSARWNVPISYSTNLELNFNNTAPVRVLKADQASLRFSLKNSSADWVVVNNQQTGYYRVNYDDDNWEKLLSVLNDPDQYDLIHEYNRAQILDDAAALGASTHEDYLPATTVLRLLPLIKHDRSLTVWRTATRVMSDILGKFALKPEFAKSYSALQNYFMELSENAFKELNLFVAESDSHYRKMLRETVVEFACSIDLPACVQQANQLYLKGEYHPDVRRVVLCEGIQNSEDSVWVEALRMAVGEESPEQSDHLHSLTCTKSDILRNRLISELSSRKVFTRDGDAITVLETLLEKRPEIAENILDVINSRSWRLKRSSGWKALNDLKHKVSVHLGAKEDIYFEQEVIESEEWARLKAPQIQSWLTASA